MQRVVTKISIPTRDGNHLQLFRYQFESSDQRFGELCGFVQQKYQSDFILRYKDDEGEMITIANESDVAEAFETAQSMNSMLKVFVSNVKSLTEPSDLEISFELPSERVEEELSQISEMEELEEPSADDAFASELASLEPPKEEAVAPIFVVAPLVSFEKPAPQPNPMERLFVATEELLKVFRSRFGVLLLIELNKILQVRDIHPKNYPAEIAMIINTQNEFSEVLQNPLYLDVVGPALFKVNLPDEFIVRVDANTSLLKQLDARSIAEYADTMMGTLCAAASQCKDKFTLRPAPMPLAAPVVVPLNLDPLEPAPVREPSPKVEPRGILSSVLPSWWGPPPKKEEPVPFVEPNAPVVAPPRINGENTDFDLLSFVDDSLENSRDDEKASEERPALVVTPAAHISYREDASDLDVLEEEFSEVEEEIVVDESIEDIDIAVASDSEAESFVEDHDDDEKRAVLPLEELPELRSRPLTHPNSLCSLCGMQPIAGLRYKCLICSDMHMCSDCERSSLHDRSHPVVKFSTATQRLYAPHELSGLRDLIDPSYHTIFFTDIQADRNAEDAMNMSTYSAVSAASLNPILMMRYMAESMRNPAALSRMLDPIPNDDGESVSSTSEFEVDVTVEEDVPDVRYQEQPRSEPSPEPEIEFPQDDEFEVAEASVDEEVDFDVKVDADPEPAVAQSVVVGAEPELVNEVVMEEPVIEEPVVVAEKSEPVRQQPPQPAHQQPPPPGAYQGRPVNPQQPQVPPQYPSMYNYQYQNQYYAPGMSTYPTTYQPYPYNYQYQQQYQPYPHPQVQSQPRPAAPANKPPPPPKREEELNDDFLLEAQPDVAKPAPVVEEPKPEPQPVVQPVVQPPPQVSVVPAVKPVAKPAAGPPEGYVPPVVSNLPAYPVLRAPEEKAAPKPEPKPQPVARPQPAPVQENQLSCYCGVPLVKMPVGDLGSVVQCDVCNAKVMKGAVYHCFEQANHGSGGYDLCLNCVSNQITSSRDDRLPQTTHAGPVPATEAMAPSAPPSAPISAVSAPASNIPPELSAHRKFKFFAGLISLHEMGIGDIETNKKLLKIHKGNVSAVMQQYFDGNVSGYHY